MITFKQYITEAGKYIYRSEPIVMTTIEHQRRASIIKGVVVDDPLRFTWSPMRAFTPEGHKTIFAVREKEKDLENGIQDKFYVTGDLASNDNIIIRPPIFFLFDMYVLRFHDYKECVRRIDKMNPVFFISPSEHNLFYFANNRPNDAILALFRIYNYYTSLTGSYIENVFKVLEFIRDNKQISRAVFPWKEEQDTLLHKLRMKYIPQDQLTDDDHAFDAALNI